MTNAQPTNPGQEELEARFLRMQEIPIDREMTAAEVYGDMESWMFALGGYRLFLNPLSGKWYFFDRVHDDFRNLDHPAGTGTFVLSGDELEFRPTQTGGTIPAGKKFCLQCGSQLTPGKMFCGNCGSKV